MGAAVNIHTGRPTSILFSIVLLNIQTDNEFDLSDLQYVPQASVSGCGD